MNEITKYAHHIKIISTSNGIISTEKKKLNSWPRYVVISIVMHGNKTTKKQQIFGSCEWN